MAGFTITGGVSFSGAVSMSDAPPPQNTAAWFGGGDGAVSTVQRITFATDTATASVRGPLSLARQSLAAASNLTDGWFGGGLVTTPAVVGTSRVDRMTYATDTATASVRGPLSSIRLTFSATGNTTDGWFGGGQTPATVTTVDRITYATDTATASVRGPLSSAKNYLAAAGGIQ